MPKFCQRKAKSSKKPPKPKNSPPQSSKNFFLSSKKSVQEIYSGRSTEPTLKKIIFSKKPPLYKRSKPEETHIKSIVLIHPSQDHKSLSSRGPSAVESKKPPKSGQKLAKSRSPCSIVPANTNKSGQVKIFDLLKTRIKSSKCRSISSRRSSKEPRKCVKSTRSSSLGRVLHHPEFTSPEKYEKSSFRYPVTCRDNYDESDFKATQIEPCKTYRTVKKTISLMDTEEFCDVTEYEKNNYLTKTKKVFNLDQRDLKCSPKACLSITKNSEKTVQNFKRTRAAVKIQREFRKYLLKVRSASARQLKDIIKEQISWKEAQIMTLEYLKKKELEDIQFLTKVFGKNDRLEELLARSVQERYDNFSNLFRQKIEEIETRFKEAVNKEEISELSLKINDRNDEVFLIIQESNLNNCMVKENIENVLKAEIEKKNPVVEERKESGFLLPPQKQIVINDIEQVDPTMLSPIFPEIMNFPDLSSLIIEGDGNEDCGVVPEPIERIEELFDPRSNKNKGSQLTLKIEAVKDCPEIKPEGISINSKFIFEYLQRVFNQIDRKVVSKVNSEIKRDPLEALEHIHNDFYGLADRYLYEPILNIEEIFKKQDFRASPEDSSERQIKAADKIHKKMLVAACDEILQYFRPYNIEGRPQIWSSKNRSLYFKKLVEEDVVETLLGIIVELSMCQMGKIPNDCMNSTDGQLDEEKLRKDRAEALEFTLNKEALENEWIWNDFEFEEIQVKLDLADIVLSELAGEVLNVI